MQSRSRVLIRRALIPCCLVALLAGCGGDGSDCSGRGECVQAIPSHGPLCYNIDGTPSAGCQTPTPMPSFTAAATKTPTLVCHPQGMCDPNPSGTPTHTPIPT